MDQNKNQTRYLKLNMGKQFILLSLHHVRIVLRMPALHEIPNETKGFEGILNYHGVSVPVYNLGYWIGDDLIKYGIETPLILCELQGSLVGLLVSDVLEVIHVDPKDIHLPKLSNLPMFVQGTYVSENESMWIIQLDNLINPDAHLMNTSDDA